MNLLHLAVRSALRFSIWLDRPIRFNKWSDFFHILHECEYSKFISSTINTFLPRIS